MALISSLSNAFVLGLLTDLEGAVDRRELDVQRLRGAAVEVEEGLDSLLSEIRSGREGLESIEGEHGRCAHRISEWNAALTSSHQRLAVLNLRAEELKKKMSLLARSSPDYRTLRRERARLTNSLEDLVQEISGIEASVAAERSTLKELEKRRAAALDELNEREGKRDALQVRIPQPGVLVELFELRVAKSNCEYFLGGSSVVWRERLGESIRWMAQLHRDLRGGRYRIDRNSEFVGGRSVATGEALYAAVAVGQKGEALELFRLACEPSLFFHEIFGVFRCWCLGLYLEGRLGELEALLESHRFSEAVRGAYVECFLGLMGRDSRRLSHGIKELVRWEWGVWLGSGPRRGMGVVNFAATAFTLLGREAGLEIEVAALTIPEM